MAEQYPLKPTEYEPFIDGDKIRRERLKKGLTQKQVGEAVDVTDVTINRIEKGTLDNATIRLGWRLAQYFRPLPAKFDAKRQKHATWN